MYKLKKHHCKLLGPECMGVQGVQSTSHPPESKIIAIVNQPPLRSYQDLQKMIFALKIIRERLKIGGSPLSLIAT